MLIVVYPRRQPYILPVNLLVVAIGLVDLVTTLIWLRQGIAIEYNPIMAAALTQGIWFFAGVKVFTLAAYLGVIEWYRRRRNPAFARFMGILTACAYTGIYAVSFVWVNFRLLFG